MTAKCSSPILLTLVCLLFMADARAQTAVPVYDLNGTWTYITDGTVISVVQRGNWLVGRILVPSSQMVDNWGWTSNELFFEGVMAAGSFSGKRYVHFPMDSKTLCPNTRTLSTEFEFQIIQVFHISLLDVY